MKYKLTALWIAICLLFASGALSCHAVGAVAETETLAPSECDALGGGAYTAIYEGIMAGEEKIDLASYDLSEDELRTVFETVCYSEAELFFISFEYQYSRAEGTDRILSVTPTYLCGKSSIPGLLADFYERTDAILAGVDAKSSAFAKIAYVHDYIAQTFTYDYTYSNYDVYSMLTEGTGVCQPYSLLARYLLRRLGVETECVTSNAINHEWNVVKLGREWYHMDITWDDCDDTGFFGRVGHLYFLCSDAEFMRGKHASDWVSPVVCDDPSYDRDFEEITSAFVYAHGDAYVICGQDACGAGVSCDNNPSCHYGDICRYDESGGRLISLYTIDEVWHTFMGATAWQGIFSGLIYLNGRLLYNTERKLCYYELETGASGELAAFPTVGGYVYGMRLDGTDVVYALKTEPNSDDYQACRARFAYKVTWMIGGVAYEEIYLRGEIPVCKESTELPEDTHRLVFIGWDKEVKPVTCDVIYTAKYSSTELYPESAVDFLALVAAAAEEGASLAERHAALSAALAIGDKVNSAYEGVAAAKGALASLVQDYDAEIAALRVFAGWVPAP